MDRRDVDRGHVDERGLGRHRLGLTGRRRPQMATATSPRATRSAITNSTVQ